MYPNEARLREMTYGVHVYYDIEVICTELDENGDEKQLPMFVLPMLSIGILPIMLHSKLCVLNQFDKMTRFSFGECKNDPGGYFIIEGNERVVISQEQFANNIINVSINSDAIVEHSHTCSVRSISEDPSKPRYKLQMHLVRPSLRYSNQNIVVDIPLVKSKIPLFILMRALGIVSDKEILQYCILDLKTNAHLLDEFVPSIHDAGMVYEQIVALRFIASYTKTKTIQETLFILSDYLLPHIGVMNFQAKAYYLGHMAYRLIRVVKGIDHPIDRDSFQNKRVDTTGSMLYSLYSDYYNEMLKEFRGNMDKEYNYHEALYQSSLVTFSKMFVEKYQDLFSSQIIQEGVLAGFKGSWGIRNRKVMGVSQILERKSFNLVLSLLRKTNINIDASTKIVAPRLVHTSQWGYIDPYDSPDGGHVGLHKYMATGCIITPKINIKHVLAWMDSHFDLIHTEDCMSTDFLQYFKLFINGTLIGVITTHIVQAIRRIRLYRRSGLIPIYINLNVDYRLREFHINVDGGRMARYIYHLDEHGQPQYQKIKLIKEHIMKGEFEFSQVMSGFAKKKIENFNYEHTHFYQFSDLYSYDAGFDLLKNQSYMTTRRDKHRHKKSKTVDRDRNDKEIQTGGTSVLDDLPPMTDEEQWLSTHCGIVELLDCAESELCYIAMSESQLQDENQYTHLEIHPSLCYSIMVNQIVFMENNFGVRNSYTPGQTKQAISMYHTNFHNRMDTSTVLTYGQTPLIKSRYYDYVTKCEHPYGENIILAVMIYSGYNVEDALILNEASVKRGMFNLTYFTTSKAMEIFSLDKKKKTSDLYFKNILKHNVKNLKKKYDYSYLDENGIIPENTQIDDRTVLIGCAREDAANPGQYIDESVTTHKEQEGFVDKVFLSKTTTGARIAKVRLRENRPPIVGDKFVSRCANKGTVGIIVKEEDMPFTKDGVRPDIIINPSSFPTRKTVGQMIETLIGKVCANYGYYSDCTMCESDPMNHEIFGRELNKMGMNGHGMEVLYNGMTGEQIEANIFIGPTYYMRLKQMVKDKINYRTKGPREMHTRQTAHGRAHDGGLRIGEMERDALIGHGASFFLYESMMKRGDEFKMAICNKTGSIAAYNPKKRIYLSPNHDGPLQFSFDENKQSSDSVKLSHVSTLEHSFSIVNVPYCFKLLMQELASMNVNMRIVTDKNIDQLKSLSYSNQSSLKNSHAETQENSRISLNDPIPNVESTHNDELQEISTDDLLSSIQNEEKNSLEQQVKRKMNQQEKQVQVADSLRQAQAMQENEQNSEESTNDVNKPDLEEVQLDIADYDKGESIKLKPQSDDEDDDEDDKPPASPRAKIGGWYMQDGGYVSALDSKIKRKQEPSKPPEGWIVGGGYELGGLPGYIRTDEKKQGMIGGNMDNKLMDVIDNLGDGSGFQNDEIMPDTLMKTAWNTIHNEMLSKISKQS